MILVLIWCSPGLVVIAVCLYKWWHGEDIVYSDLKLLGYMSTLGMFIPMVQNEILYMEDPRILISGRKLKVEKEFTVKNPLSGYHFTTKPGVVERISEALIRRKGLCPCTLADDKNHICHCLEYRLSGLCRCGLYVKDN